jgi:hypothetical protein
VSFSSWIVSHHPLSCFFGRWSAAQRLESALSTLSALAISLMLVIGAGPSPDLYVMVVRVIGGDRAGPAEMVGSMATGKAPSGPSELPTLSGDEYIPELTHLAGYDSWTTAGRRGLNAGHSYQLEWLPRSAMMETRDALSEVICSRRAAMGELDLQAQFQVELEAQWGVYLPVHADGRSVAEFHADWTPTPLLLFAQMVAAVALAVDLCIRCALKQMRLGHRRTTGLAALAAMAATLVTVALVMLSRAWLLGAGAHRGGERVTVYAADGDVEAEYFVADYAKCVSPPFIGCGLWGCGSADPFLMGGLSWLLVLGPTVLLIIALLAPCLQGGRFHSKVPVRVGSVVERVSTSR